MQLSVRQREFIEALSRTAALPPNELELYQRKLLEELLQHARANVPFYRNRLEPIFSHPNFSWDRWREIPILTRREARAAGLSLQTETLPAGNDRWVEEETSGSTSASLRHRRSNLTDLATRCQFERAYNWWAMDCDQTLALIGLFQNRKAEFPAGMQLGKWSMRGDGNFVGLDVRSHVAQQIQWLQHVRPQYLQTYPSVLRELADYVLASGKIGLWLDKVVTLGEPLPPDLRAATQKAFGATIFDRYGAQEIGHLAAECPSCRQYHTAAESVFIEILNDDGTVTEPGQVGRVVVTSLYNYAMPFIRYELGDLAEMSWSNVCARRLPSLRRILGPARNVFTASGGNRILPDLPLAELRHFLDFAAVQIAQISKEEIELRYVPTENNRKPDESGLQTYLRSRIDSNLRVRLVALHSIPRLPSGKFQQYISCYDKDAR